METTESKELIKTKTLPEHEMLAWANAVLETRFAKVEELGNGAVFCQLMDMIFPGAVNLKQVKFCTIFKADCIKNFEILGEAFQKMHIDKTIAIESLVNGNFEDNLELLEWFGRLFNGYYDGRCYDPVGARNGLKLNKIYYYGPVKPPTPVCSSFWAPTTRDHSPVSCPFCNGVFGKDPKGVSKLQVDV